MEKLDKSSLLPLTVVPTLILFYIVLPVPCVLFSINRFYVSRRFPCISRLWFFILANHLVPYIHLIPLSTHIYQHFNCLSWVLQGASLPCLPSAIYMDNLLSWLYKFYNNNNIKWKMSILDMHTIFHR